MHPINVRIPPDLLRLIDADVARRNGDRTWRKVTRSDAIRLCLRERLDALLDEINPARVKRGVDHARGIVVPEDKPLRGMKPERTAKGTR